LNRLLDEVSPGCHHARFGYLRGGPQRTGPKNGRENQTAETQGTPPGYPAELDRAARGGREEEVRGISRFGREGGGEAGRDPAGEPSGHGGCEKPHRARRGCILPPRVDERSFRRLRKRRKGAAAAGVADPSYDVPGCSEGT